jgi:hypothetical protein
MVLHRELYPASLVGERLKDIRLMGIVRLYFGDYYLQIEDPEFVVRQPGGDTTVKFNPARNEEPTGLDSLGRLFGKSVATAQAHDDGSLIIDFADGFGLVLSAGSGYEPWTLTGPLGTLVSLPSGGLSSFPR